MTTLTICCLPFFLMAGILTGLLLLLIPVLAPSTAFAIFIRSHFHKMFRPSELNYAARPAPPLPPTPKPPSPIPFRKKSIVTSTEMTFYKTLLQCVPPGTILLTKVHLRDLFHFNDRRGEGRTLYNQCCQMHADFVLANATTLIPIAVIELDDRSHTRTAAQRRDQRKNEFCQRAGIAIVRVPVMSAYPIDNLRRQLQQLTA